MLLQLHFAATAALFGLIWYVQVVHYPVYRLIGEREFPAYHFRSTQVTAWVVLPLMLTELVTGAWLWWLASGGERVIWTVSMGLLGAVWASTVFLQVPCHHFLSAGKDEKLIRSLLWTNWIRVAGWTGRVVILVCFLG